MKSYADYETDLEIQKYFEPGFVGVCLDIGAGSGTERNDTFYFENKYWRCVCIEPNPKLYNHLRMYRRLAINLACSDYDKNQVPFFVYDINDGNQEAISSLVVDQRLVESHKEMINEIKEIKVDVRKIDTILSKINLERVDFLTIDTEGTELEVLRGFDIKKWNPRLFVIENNFNETKVSEYLKEFGYSFSQRVGVNDFFVRDSEPHNTPPITKSLDLDIIFEI